MGDEVVGPSRARDILSSIGWLSLQPEDFQAEVFKRAIPVKNAAGDVIYRVGSALGGIYGIVSGAVVVNVAPPNATPHALHTLTPGGWIGEACFLSRELRRVAAMENTPVPLAQAALGLLANTSRKTVNAALQRFAKAGYRSVTITNLKGLSRFAEGETD